MAKRNTNEMKISSANEIAINKWRKIMKAWRMKIIGEENNRRMKESENGERK
jgi:hypothetical protein